MLVLFVVSFTRRAFIIVLSTFFARQTLYFGRQIVLRLEVSSRMARLCVRLCTRTGTYRYYSRSSLYSRRSTTLVRGEPEGANVRQDRLANAMGQSKNNFPSGNVVERFATRLSSSLTFRVSRDVEVADVTHDRVIHGGVCLQSIFLNHAALSSWLRTITSGRIRAQ